MNWDDPFHASFQGTSNHLTVKLRLRAGNWESCISPDNNRQGPSHRVLKFSLRFRPQSEFHCTISYNGTNLWKLTVKSLVKLANRREYHDWRRRPPLYTSFDFRASHPWQGANHRTCHFQKCTCNLRLVCSFCFWLFCRQLKIRRL